MLSSTARTPGVNVVNAKRSIDGRQQWCPPSVDALGDRVGSGNAHLQG